MKANQIETISGLVQVRIHLQSLYRKLCLGRLNYSHLAFHFAGIRRAVLA